MLSMWTIGQRRATRIAHSTSSQPQPANASSKASASNTSRRTSRLEVNTDFSGARRRRLAGRQSLCRAMVRCRACSGASRACLREKPPNATGGSPAATRSSQPVRKSASSGSMSLSRNSRWPALAWRTSRLRPLERPSLRDSRTSRAGRGMASTAAFTLAVRAGSPEPSSSSTTSASALSRPRVAISGVGSSPLNGMRTERRGAAASQRALSNKVSRARLMRRLRS